MPHPIPVTNDGREIDGSPSIRWSERDGFNEFAALEIEPSDEDGTYDIYINMDNIYLLNELRRERNVSEHGLITYYFKYGLLLVSMGMLHENKRTNGRISSNGREETNGNALDDLQAINEASKGIATVIVPVVQRLSASAEKTLQAV